MEITDYLIIGGGIAGTTAAQTIRQHDAAGTITIVSDEPHRCFARIMLSKPRFFLGQIPLDQVWLRSENWYREQRITLAAGRTAVRIDAAAKTVTLDDNSTLAYGKLLLAVGAQPNHCTVDGASGLGVRYLRTLDDARAIMTAVKSARRAVCIGGGFVSFEMCEMLRKAGLHVALVIREPHYWDPLLDADSGRMIEAALKRGGIKIFRNALVKTVVRKAQAITGVMLQSGTRVPCELIIPGLGVCVKTDWLAAAGVAVNRGVVTNEYLESNVPDVWAAGDCAEFNDLVLGERVQLGNWVNAQQQGKIAGRNMAGDRLVFRMVSFYTTQGFGITIAFAGDVRVAGREVIRRGSPKTRSYARLLVDEHDELVGATFINRTQELGYICRLIERDAKITPLRGFLADGSYNLRLLAP